MVVQRGFIIVKIFFFLCKSNRYGYLHKVYPISEDYSCCHSDEAANLAAYFKVKHNIQSTTHSRSYTRYIFIYKIASGFTKIRDVSIYPISLHKIRYDR